VLRATYFKLLAGSTLDTLLTLPLKVVPVYSGSFISYTEERSWRVDAWRDGETYFVQVGGFELVVDLHPNAGRI
jgi:hypothetical protein